jgi:hypothetical protein
MCIKTKLYNGTGAANAAYVEKFGKKNILRSGEIDPEYGEIYLECTQEQADMTKDDPTLEFYCYPHPHAWVLSIQWMNCQDAVLVTANGIPGEYWYDRGNWVVLSDKRNISPTLKDQIIAIITSMSFDPKNALIPKYTDCS